jgi:hypothetical protein
MTETLEQHLTAKNTYYKNPKFLPLCHTTKYGYCLSIVEKGFEPNICSVYNQQLVYFFYGKSRYSVDAKKKEASAIKKLDEMPVAFLFDFNAILEKISFVRYLPFDSGGFPRYELSKKEDFEITKFKKGEKILEIIRLIYSNHKTYLADRIHEGNLRAEASYNKAVNQLKGFYVDKGMLKNDIGKQSMALEIQIGDKVSDQPIVVLIPFLEATSERFKETMNALTEKYASAVFIPYLDPTMEKQALMELDDPFESDEIPDIDDKDILSPTYYDAFDCESRLRGAVFNEVLSLCRKTNTTST